MCVIITKEKGQKMPSLGLLASCYRANPDGCGFVSTRHSFKSLNFTDFYRHLSRVKDDEACIIHFRFATHGGVCQRNCHPFKIGKVAFAHNGVLPIEPLADKTDSETAFIEEIYPAIQRYGWGNRRTDAAINRVRGGSRFAFLVGGKIKTYGNFVDYEGYKFSNLNFLYRYW
jgi:hypothetical protein